MSDRVSKSNSSYLTGRLANIPIPASDVGIVLDVVLDENHPRVKSLSNYMGLEGFPKDTSIIGGAIIRKTTDSNTPLKKLLVYPPFTMIDGIPIIGERVQLIQMGGRTFYKRFTNGNISVGNASYNANKLLNPLLEPRANKVIQYLKELPILKSGASVDNQTTRTYGKYFKKQQINPLKLYEGDTLIQSRFGQSIRFSGYNNEDKSFSPTITIRNRQRRTGDIEEGEVITEDVNRDGSVIVMSSKDHKINFKRGLIDSKDSSNFQTNPDNFDNFPNDLSGYDQILMNSDRIIFSAKSQEMIFFSKGNYGFISDGKLSIDNGKAGADMEFNGDVNLKTKNGRNIYLDGQKRGNIFLNTDKRDEPLVRGDALVGILRELIQAINNQVYLTPAGPTSTGPTNRAKFIEIRSKLTRILSTLNYTE